jgi:hypothetical protein
MLLVGDFNCEPGDWPFKYQQMTSPARPNMLKGVREHGLVLRGRNRLAFFYNPMWRWLVLKQAKIPGPAGLSSLGP